ncbi:type II toxin-antitoxin system VapB family antitoxin [Mesorhizobium sp. M0633]|uniref:type II toxin-antitoxin system VapB family antitoxin n=1 Tax=Mesorhizobium sp. M0633 TaxID=2956977 RepID=UPI00333872BF
MAFHIKNPETDALARRVAALKRTGLTEAVHAALKHELEREQARPSLVEIGVRFCRDLRARGKPDHGRPADKAFRDSLPRMTDVHRRLGPDGADDQRG